MRAPTTSSLVALLWFWIYFCLTIAADEPTGSAPGTVDLTTTIAPAVDNSTATEPTPTSGSGSGEHLLPEDMRTFLYKVLESKPSCTEAEKAKLFQCYANNKVLFSECFDATGYVIFPNKGTPPTQQQIELFVNSMSCMKLFTGLVRAHYRECEIYSFSPRSGAETMLRIRHDVMVEKRPTPNSDQYQDVYLYNRAVNTLTFNPKIRQQIYAKGANQEYAYDKLVAMRSKMYLVPGVTMTDDMRIIGDAGSGSASGIDSSDFGEKVEEANPSRAPTDTKSVTSGSAAESSAPTTPASSWLRVVIQIVVVSMALVAS